MRKDLHNSPTIFWLLAAIAVGSFIFAIYTFEITKPSRKLSYREFSQNFSFPDDLSESITVKGEKEPFHPRPGFIREIYIWNDGNLEIEPSYVLKPIKIELPEDGRFIDIQYRNVDKINGEYQLFNNTIELKLEKLLPKAGFIIRYFSANNTFNPSIEGLISDPIRGASRVGNPIIQTILPRVQKNEAWYWEIVTIIFLPISCIGILQVLKDLNPVSKLGKILKSIVYYPLIVSISIFTCVRLFDIFLTRPPFN